MIPRISPRLWNLFGRYAEWYVPRHFHAVHLLAAAPPAAVSGKPLVIYLNHPSWWDPMICILLARRFWPDRQHYAPIDAAALQRYRFFQKLGFFGVEQESRRGGAMFLRTAKAILRQPSATLWITAQGEFTDPRSRPIRLRPGLGHLLPHLENGTVLPLAIEYPFWDERHPEVLTAFGAPIDLSLETPRPADEWTALLESRLQQTTDLLSTAAISRDPARFNRLRDGSAGVSFFYDLWLRAKSTVTRRPYHREHSAGVR